MVVSPRPYPGSSAVYVILHRDTYRMVLHLIYFHAHVSYLMSLKIQLLMICKCAAGFRLLVRIVFVTLLPVVAQKY